MLGKAPLNGASLLPSVAPQDAFWGLLRFGAGCVCVFALVVQLQQVAHPMALRGLQQFGSDRYLFIGVR